MTTDSSIKLGKN